MLYHWVARKDNRNEFQEFQEILVFNISNFSFFFAKKRLKKFVLCAATFPDLFVRAKQKKSKTKYAATFCDQKLRDYEWRK